MLQVLNRQLAASEKSRELRDNGFVLVPNLIPSSRVDEFRTLAQKEGSQPNTHKTSVFWKLIEELGVHRTVQSYFDEQIFYYGWVGIRPGLKPNLHHYHHDAKGFALPETTSRIDLLTPKRGTAHDVTKDELWPNYRLFIYLDDHVDYSGGTKIRRGSHRRHDVTSRQGLKALSRMQFDKVQVSGTGYVNPRIRPGDAALFNLRCRHAGYFVRLRGPLENVALPVAWDNLIKRIALRNDAGRKFVELFARPFPALRTAINIDFCTDSDWARGFQLNRLTEKVARPKQDQVLDCVRPDFRARLEKSGIQILRNPHLPAIERFLTAN